MKYTAAINFIRLFEFIRTRPFDSAWRQVGLDDDDLRGLEYELCAAPKKGPAIRGIGGLRKLRVAIRTGQGKSGGGRVGYAFFEAYGVILLAAFYPKNQRENLTVEQERKIELQLRGLEGYLRGREKR